MNTFSNAEFIHSRLMAMPEASDWTPQKSDWAFLAIVNDDSLQRLVTKYLLCDSRFAPRYLSNIDEEIRAKFDLTNAELV